MASEYTTNYQLDLYVGEDRPNLCDQYNSAMRKLDSVIYNQTGQGTQALVVANQALSLAQEASDDADTALSSIGTVEDSVESLETTVQANTSAIAQTATDLTAETTARIAADTRLENMITGFSAAKNSIGIIGDSFSSGGEWAQLVAAQTGCSVINKSVSGAGFCVANNTFLSQLNSLIADTNFDDVHTIIVYGGTNDEYNSATEANVVSAMQSFINVYNTIPTPRPRLIIAYANMGYARSASYNAFGPWYSRVCAAVREANIPGFVDNVPYWLWGTANAFISDNLHPSNTGYKVIADYMMQLIMGTYSGVHFTRRVTASVGTGSAQVSFHNGIVELSIIANNHALPTINGSGTKLADFSAYTFTFGDSTRANIVCNETDYIIRISAGSNSNVENTLLKWKATLGELWEQRWGASVLTGTESTNATFLAFGW